MNQLNVLGIGMAHDFMSSIVHRLHRFGVTMNAKRIDIKRSLDTVFVQYAQNAPDACSPSVIVLAGRATIVRRLHVLLFNRIRSAHMARAAELRARGLGPSF